MNSFRSWGCFICEPIPRNCLCKPQARAFRRAGCREIRMSGSTRGEWAGISVLALSPTLPVKSL